MLRGILLAVSVLGAAADESKCLPVSGTVTGADPGMLRYDSFSRPHLLFFLFPCPRWYVQWQDLGHEGLRWQGHSIQLWQDR